MTSSPPGCPKVSLTFLKKSMSIDRSEKSFPFPLTLSENDFSP